MRIEKERILIHADKTLPVLNSEPERQEQVASFRKFLKFETERLRIRHRFGLGGCDVASARSHLIDLIIRRACRWVAAGFTASLDIEKSCAAVALGGYGRGELAPFSDVDLLFLHAGRRYQEVKAFVEQVQYLLWDIGLTVGHSFRSVGESVALARKDLPSRTAMAEARLITGNAHLFHRLTRKLDQAVLKNRREVEAFIEAMRLELEARYAKFGRAVCLQEPNVKESAGGLRDLHTVLWVAQAKFGCCRLDDLRAEDLLSGTGYTSVDRAYNFVARVRNEAHFSTGRKTDLLTLDLQPTLAANLGYGPKRGLLASERFMREYYQRAHELHQVCEGFLLRTLESRRTQRRYSLRAARPRNLGHFEVRHARLSMSGDPRIFRRNPLRLMEAFAVAQVEGLALSDELRQAIGANLSLVGRQFRASPDVGQAFLEILRRRGHVGRALRMMHETGFLGRFLPEFARITFLVQHDFYHAYTIDEHTLKAVDALDEVAGGNTLLGEVFAEVQDAATLYLGLLLHDIGKGRSGSHVPRGVRLAERVCHRLRLDSSRTPQVRFLVRHHLLMSHLSQRRDLADERLIQEFVATVATLENLNRLVLLTYADTTAVGPGVWNDWKGALLWELYTRARSRLTGVTPGRWSRHRRARFRQQIDRELVVKFLPSEIERHLAMLPERYLRTTEPGRIAQHLRLIKRLEAEPLVVDWQTVEPQRCTELTICTGDRAGLFALIAGTLTAQGINILSAELYTREDDVVIDSFKICDMSGPHPIRPERWPKIEHNLKAALEDRVDVAAAVETWRAKAPRRRMRHLNHRLVPPTVHFDLAASTTSTVVEVKAEDEPGLAYTIASRLTALGLNISFAKVGEEKSLALDVFYVTDSAGQRLSPPMVSKVEHALLDALGGESQPGRT